MGESTAAIAVDLRKIAIAIKSQDGDTMYFRVAKEKKMQDLLKIYCKGKNFLYSEMSFIHNGLRIQPSQTVFQLDIEDGDVIDAMKHHGGGGNPAAFA
ncbi:small ubiquitin-related modifier 2-like [Salvia divinorum]|uniref:Small ubiquitin-related modifier 2-like n=1 Tax=Salvia divinorum TaxID=28513 RepID=A0ABD1GZ54_SALDI